MPFPKEAIKEILDGLDHTNDALWTDDGSPLVTEIQRLANDRTVTRAQINEASPGFARKTSDSITEEVQPEDEADVEAAVSEIIAAAPASEVQAGAGDEPLSPEDEHLRLRALAQRRVADAEAAVTAAKDAVSDANRAVAQAEARHTRALQLFASKYPPLTAAEAIKVHLRSQQENLRERMTGSRFEPNVAQNPVDATMMDRKRNNGRNGQSQKATSFLPRSVAPSR